MIPIVRAFRDDRYRRIVAILGAQMGKTDGLLNVLGHRLEDDPTPAIYIGPTRQWMETQLEPRLKAMLRSAPALHARWIRGQRDRKTAKIISGVSLRLGWAGSAAEVASQNAGLVMVDERDRMEGDVAGEGDVVDLLEARGDTFPDFKLGVTSTPTEGSVEPVLDEQSGLWFWSVGEDVASATWALWQSGTRFHWAWPCPDCREYFIPRLRLLVWDEGASPAQAERSARLRCPRCEAQILDRFRGAMNDAGRFVAPGQRVTKKGEVVGDPPDSSTASFWASGLASPWRTFGAAARRYVAAAHSGDQNRVRAVVNTVGGELYRTTGESVKHEDLARLRLGYEQDELPDGVRIITCGVDPGKYELNYVVRGWGYRMESWLIRHGKLPGETEFEPVWSDLEQLLNATWGDQRIGIRAMLIDSGYKPGLDRHRRPDHRVYQFARRFPGLVRAAKGQDSLDQPVKISRIDITLGGRRVRKAIDLVHVDTDRMKLWIRGRVDWPEDEPGGWHVPIDATDEYLAELAAEERLVAASGRSKWIRKGPNHAFDCEVLALASAYLLGVHLIRPDGPGPAPQRRVRSAGTPLP